MSGPGILYLRREAIRIPALRHNRAASSQRHSGWFQTVARLSILNLEDFRLLQLTNQFRSFHRQVCTLESQLRGIRDSIVSGNQTGLYVDTGEMNVENCMVTHNTTAGVRTDEPGAIIRISNSTITKNAIGVQQVVSTTIYTRLNNTIEGNGTDVSGSLTTYTAK